MVTPLERALIKALERLNDEGECVPAMQLLLIRINGVDHQCFSSVIAEEEGDALPNIEGIQIGDIIPMSMVIHWLQKAHDSWIKGQHKDLQ